MTTVFHHGELTIQTESGVDERVKKIGNKVIRDHIIDQHKAFFESLPYVFVALQDNDQRPWVSLMQGEPGFINSPEPTTLNINAKVVGADELGLQTEQGMPIGIVGLDFSTRRRNRLNGSVKKANQNDLLSIDVTHSFGNCPKYIQLRNFTSSNDDQKIHAEHFIDLSELDINFIRQADTLLIASAEKKGGNLDASHRGGKPGFVNVKNSKQLWFDDYPGNNFFQTFGNICSNPNVGLMFLDFKSGDLLLLCGNARLANLDQDLSSSNDSNTSKFLHRRFYFTLDKGLKLRNAVHGQWSSVEFSPFLDNISR